MTTSSRERLGIKGIDSLHFFVRDLARSRDHYVERLEFDEVAVSSPVFEQSHGMRACTLEAGSARFVFLSPLSEESESGAWLREHPEGVGRVVLEVEQIEHAYALLCRRGATPIGAIEHARTADGEQSYFDIATPLGDTLFRFVARTGRGGLLPGMLLAEQTSVRNAHAISEIDHITSNFLTLQPALVWMEQVLGLERYWGIEFHTRDVTGAEHGGSGLRSVVMWDPESGVKFANNEPAAPAYHASQIYRFCKDHRGAGVQHVALSVAAIEHSVRSLRARGVTFMPTPRSYYERLPERLIELGIERIDEQIDTLSALEILVDGDGPGRYLLQIFVRDAAGLFDDQSAGPLFIELIQRKGDQGFGAGNFRALFESIERQQVDTRAA
jgi:4-hydroxyphenylpyruvate dioxygenase